MLICLSPVIPLLTAVISRHHPPPNPQGTLAANVTVTTSDTEDWSAFYPATFAVMTIRDAHHRADLGTFHDAFTLEVPPLDARILRVIPTSRPAEKLPVSSAQ